MQYDMMAESLRKAYMVMLLSTVIEAIESDLVAADHFHTVADGGSFAEQAARVYNELMADDADCSNQRTTLGIVGSVLKDLSTMLTPDTCTEDLQVCLTMKLWPTHGGLWPSSHCLNTSQSLIGAI